MTKFDEVTERFGELEYMTMGRAKLARRLIKKSGASNLLEIGFWKGKSSAYLAAILEDQGHGHLTTIDTVSAKKHVPSINSVLGDLKLSHRVTPIFAERSYTWELAKMLQQSPRPQFDFCYFDGGHTWDETGFGLVLVDMLLKPGGILVVDDLDWTINESIQRMPGRAGGYAGFSEDEKASPSVKRAFHTILPHLGYMDLRRVSHQWGVARKPKRRGRTLDLGGFSINIRRQ